MELVRIAIQGFLGYRERAELEFTSITGVCAVTGKNGAGKSSIQQAIGWAITGRLRISNEKDSVVNDFEDHAEVTLDLKDSSGHTYRIHRFRGYRGRTVLQLYLLDDSTDEWNTLGSHRIDDVQEHIYEVLGIDENTIYSILLIDQTSEGSRFVNSHPATRLAILRNQIGELRIWHRLTWFADRLHEEAEEKLDKIAAEVTSLTSRIDTMEEQLRESQEQLSLLPSEDELVTRGEELDIEIRELTTTIQDASSGRGDLDGQLTVLRSQRRAANAEIEVKRDRLQIRLDAAVELRRALDKAEQLAKDIADGIQETKLTGVGLAETESSLTDEQVTLQERVDRYATATSEASGRIPSLRTEAGAVQRRIDGLKVQQSEGSIGTCWVCDSTLTADQVSEHLQRLNTELESIQEQLASSERAVADSKRAFQRADEALSVNRKQLATVQRQMDSTQNRLDRQLTDQRETEEDLLRLRRDAPSEEQVEQLREEVQQLVPLAETEDEERLVEALRKMDATHPLSSRLEDRKRERSTVTSRLRDVSRATGRQEKLEDDLRSARSALRVAKKGIPDAKKEVETRKWVVRACTEKGVPGMLMDTTLRKLEEKMNDILRRLNPDGRHLTVELRQSRELKSREGVKDGLLDIVVTTPDGYERMVESFSTGERIRLSMASVFAQLQVLNDRSGSRVVSSLFLDEPFGNLDADVLPVMLDVIREAISSGIVDTVYVITHQQEVIDATSRRVIVDRSPETNYSPSITVA